MKKILSVAAVLVIIAMFASCSASRDSMCPSHDPNFFRKANRR